MLQFLQNIWEAISAFFTYIFDSIVAFSNAVELTWNSWTYVREYVACFGPEVMIILGWCVTISFIWLILKVIHG